MTMDPLSWLDDELACLTADQLFRSMSTRQGAQRAETICLDDDSLLNFSSNDYLGYAAELATASLDRWLEDGFGSGASPAISGRSVLHEELETQLARFKKTEAALLFSSGYAANIGTIPALTGPDDMIFSDSRNHASIIDGCRLSAARVAIYRHCDMDHLEQLLADSPGARRRLIVSDSLFSMDGDLAPLEELTQLAEDHHAMLMVDEAHATGIFGASGSGLVEQSGVADGVHVRVGTLSKAIGSAGGFVAGSAQLVQWLSNRARSYLFSTAAPPPLAAASLQSLEWLRQQPQRRQQVLEHAVWLRSELFSQGWKVRQHPSQIISIPIGHPGQVLEISRALREQGLMVPAIRPPTVPVGESMLRVSVSYHHGEAELNQLLTALGSCRSSVT